MNTTFDRYLLQRYASAFGILFVCTFGLFVVIDGFTNVDEFQDTADGTLAVLANMAEYYLYQSAAFFDLIAPILAIISATVVFALLMRNSELHPVLAAGIPAYRLLTPVVVGTLLVSALVVANQELVIPRIAHRIQAPRGQTDRHAQDVEPIYDYESHIRIDGRRLYPGERRLSDASFLLPVSEIVFEPTTLEARTAVYLPADGDRPAGWKLQDITTEFARLPLTDAGRRVVLPLQDPQTLLVATAVSFDQLYNRSRSYRYATTPELVRRIRNPAFGTASVRGITLHLHSRLVAPLANVASVLVAVPLIIRRESRSLVVNLALSTGVLIVVYGLAQLSLYLGRVNLISPDLAAWSPTILAGTLAAGLSGWAQS